MMTNDLSQVMISKFTDNEYQHFTTRASSFTMYLKNFDSFVRKFSSEDTARVKGGQKLCKWIKAYVIAP